VFSLVKIKVAAFQKIKTIFFSQSVINQKVSLLGPGRGIFLCKLGLYKIPVIGQFIRNPDIIHA
jgi:hypothetical protein